MRRTVATLVVLAIALAAPGRLPAQSVDNHGRMVDLLADLGRQRPFGTEYVTAVDRLRVRIDALPNNVTLTQQLAMIQRLAEAEIRAAKPAAAFGHLDEVLRGLRFLPSSQQLRLTINGRFWLGALHLQNAFVGNCHGPSASTLCSMSFGDDSVHQHRESAQDAIKNLNDVLNLTQPEAPENMAARWLLNLAYMTIGGFPEAVPARYRLNPALFPRQVASMRPFEEIGSRLSIETFSTAGGIALEDFDGDGWLDVMASSSDLVGQVRFFRNDGRGSFIDRTVEAGLTGITGGLNLVQADYDNDGDVDLLILRGAWLGPMGRHPNSLLRNDGSGAFTDVTFSAGLGSAHYPTQVGAWADYDDDGDLDLYVGNESSGSERYPSQLFRNEGDGTFTDVAVSAGVTNERMTKGAAWGDYDGDGDADLYVSNFREENRLYRNEGDGTFTDMAPALDVTGPLNSYSAWFWDVDNDGISDLLVNGYRTPQTAVPDLWYYAADLLGYPHPADRPALYIGDGQGGFRDQASRFGVARVSLAAGGNFGDLNNDGWLDFYLGTGYPGVEALVPNLMYRNEGGDRFTDVTYAGGFGHLQKGQGVAFADYDNDGDEDVFARLGGLIPRDAFVDAVYRNPGFGNNWLTLRLQGERSNRLGIGARVTATIVEGGETRTLHRVVGETGSFGANPLRLHLGLGAASHVERLEIEWPTSRTRQVFERVRANQRLRITEGIDELQRLDTAAQTGT